MMQENVPAKECELSTLPRYEARDFFLWIAKMAEAYLEIPENKRRFKEWRKAQVESEVKKDEQMENVQQSDVRLHGGTSD